MAISSDWPLVSFAQRRNAALMPEESYHSLATGPKAAMLRWAVHADVLLRSPAAYLRCAWWWITGKKLRARMRLAPLLGQSPLAYRLWQLSARNASTGALVGPSGVTEKPRIMALVCAGKGAAITLSSCASEGFEAEIIEGPDDLKALDLTQCDWVLPVNAGDILAEGAGAHYRAAAAACNSATRIIYADDDRLNKHKNKGSAAPHLKPDWNSELFEHFDYITGAALLRIGDVSEIIENGSGWATSLTRDAVARSEAEGSEPVHLRQVLHHRGERPHPRLPLATAVSASAKGTLPRISVIIPTRNRVDLLRVCLKGLLQTDYPGELDIIVIDNGSDDPATLEYLGALDEGFARVMRDDGPFNFAALNNRAVQRAAGELLCFLNNDIEIRDPNWLTIMASQAMRENVGAVGARLLYPDGLIQHAGVVTGIGGAAAHAHRRLSPDEEGYFHRHSLPQFVSAVTAACLVMRRDRFLEIGGFDDERFPVSFNDVDLCLRLGARGWRCLYEPRATLVHHESVSRGLDRDKDSAARQAREVAALQKRWKTGLATAAQTREGGVPDPFHHPGLSPLSEHFVLHL